MKIVLINPPTQNVTYGKYAKLGGKNAPLAMCYLAGIVRHYIKDIDVKILDADILNLRTDQVLKYIRLNTPDLIGITGVTATFYLAKNLTETIKKEFPKIKIVVGGPHASTLPVEVMKNECFDYLIFGEGEVTFLELVQGKPLNKINGLVYREKGKIKMNPPRELIKNLDDLPFPAMDLLPNIHLYHPQAVSYRRMPCLSMITTRGCPYHCQFCDQSVFTHKYREHSPERLVAEVKLLVEKYGVKEIKFIDDNFSLNSKRVEKVCDLLIKENLDVEWVCSGRVDMELKLLKKMRDAGCWQICIGIESGNQKVLDFIHKNIKLQRVRDFVTEAHRVGIKTRGFFIIGHPIDTAETIDDTINFALSMPLYTAEFSLCTPFPHTELSEIASNYGVVSGDLANYSTLAPSFVPKGLTAEFLVRKQREGHKKFYFRPHKMLEFLIDMRSVEHLRKYANAFQALVLK